MLLRILASSYYFREIGVATIKALLVLEELSDSTHKTLANLYNYLYAHRDHIDYARFKELGLPIGSGLVESACKWLTLREQRLVVVTY